MAKITGKILGWVGYTTGLGTNSWHDDNDANLRKIDALLQANATKVMSPPGSPTDGSVYLIDVGATSGWSGKDNYLARWSAGLNAWEYFYPSVGWRVTVGSSDYRWSGTAWVQDYLPLHAPRHYWDGPDPIAGQSLAGLLPTSVPEFGGGSFGGSLWFKASGNRVWSMLGSASSLEIASRNSDGSAIDWPLTIGHSAGGQIILGGSTNRTVKTNSTLNAIGAIQQNGVDAVTSTREGRFTGLRLSNLSSRQIPVASDANGQITASGLTDDGTFLGASRVLRMWNSLARSGNTWTDLQWSQDVNERVSVLSSNSSGQYAYHSWVFVPADSEATGRVLGGQMWAQKVSGKSGTAPGLKAAMYAKTAGTGGSTGGFGAQIVFNYRPDNGATQVDALKIGAFGGGVADAVQAEILLRANADFLATYAKIQRDSSDSVGLDVIGSSGTGKFRMVNTGAGSELGVPSGALEIICANGVAIGAPGGSGILVSYADTSISNPFTSGATKSQFFERTNSGATPANETLIVYTGSSNATESLPAATGSKRIIEFSHCGTGGWTLDADGTDLILDGGSSGVGSVTILPTNATRARRYFDFQYGKWARL